MSPFNNTEHSRICIFIICTLIYIIFLLQFNNLNIIFKYHMIFYFNKKKTCFAINFKTRNKIHVQFQTVWAQDSPIKLKSNIKFWQLHQRLFYSYIQFGLINFILITGHYPANYMYVWDLCNIQYKKIYVCVSYHKKI
jgi:hypothetical protein